MFSRAKQVVIDRLGITRVARAADVNAAELADLRASTARLQHQVEMSHRAGANVGLFERLAANTALVRALHGGDDVTISVVLPTRNRAARVRRAIDSVLAQDHQRWQLVVVDDGSTDDTPGVVTGIDDARITYVRGEGRGASAARNIGLAHATGEWVAFLDDDNVLDPGWLHAIAFFAARHPDDIVMYGAQIRQLEAEPDGSFAEAIPFFTDGFDPKILLEGNLIDMGMLAVRRGTDELWFDESLRRFVDWDLVVRLLASHPARALPVWSGVYTTEATTRITHTSDAAAIAEFQARLADPNDPLGRPGRRSSPV